MEVYLTDIKNNYTFRFPVAPLDKIDIKTNKSLNSYKIIGYGAIEQPKEGEEIVELSFNTLLPRKYEPFCKYSDLQLPQETLSMLEKMRDSMFPLKLLITGLNFNNYVLLTKLTPTIRHGESDDIYIDLTFHKYREPKIVVYNEASISKYDNKFITDSGLIDNRDDINLNFKPGDVCRVVTNSINIYDYYDFTYNTFGFLKNGTIFQLIKVMNNWGAINLQGREGWVNLDKVEKLNEWGGMYGE